MKQLTLIAAMALLYLGARQGTLPQIVQDNDAKLQAAKSFTATYSVKPSGEAAVEYELAFTKPNLLKITWADGFYLIDGKTIFAYTAKDNTWTETPVTDDSLKAFAVKPEIWGWSSLFESDNLKGIESAKVGSSRTIKGNASTEVDETFTDKSMAPATVYIDQKLGVVRSYNVNVNSHDMLIIASDIQVGDQPMDASKFTFSAPAGAKKAEPVKAGPNFATVQQILNDNCMPCHSSTGKRAGLDLSNYAGISQGLTPGNSAASLIVKSLKGDGVKRMPLNRAPLSDDNIKTISDWIDAGAKQ